MLTLDDLRRPADMPAGSVCVLLTYTPAGDPASQWSQSCHYWREPQDMAACVANCLDYARTMRRSGAWTWSSVTVTYGEEV